MNDVLVARTGITNRGLPVSINLPPEQDLARHVARLFITIVDQPDDAMLEDFIVSETGFIRILLTGDWQTLEGDVWRDYRGPILFGAQSRPFRCRVRGPFAMCGFAILPGAWRGLTGIDHRDLADRVKRLVGPVGDRLDQAGPIPGRTGRPLPRSTMRCATGSASAGARSTRWPSGSTSACISTPPGPSPIWRARSR